MIDGKGIGLISGLVILLTGMPSQPLQAQSEKNVRILPFHPSRKKPRTVKKKEKRKTDQPVDTVAQRLKKETEAQQPEKATSTLSTTYNTTEPAFIARERDQYLKGNTASSTRHIQFDLNTVKGKDALDGDARTRPVNPGSYTDGRGAGIGVGNLDFNHALSMAFSKNARLRAKNAENRYWEKWEQHRPDSLTAATVSDQPTRMLSRPQQDEFTRKANTLSNSSPSYPGGMTTLQEFIQSRLNYPYDARMKGVSGKVAVRVYINENGTVYDAKVLESADYLLNNEALRVCKETKGWKPATNDGKPVKGEFIVSVLFRLPRQN